MNREVPIFFTIDNSYAHFLSVALYSAIAHADPDRHYRAIVLYQDLSAENRDKLKALETLNFKIDLTPMQANFEALDDRMSNRLRCDYFTLTIYFRLFIPTMFPQYDKAIYIDSDVVVNADLGELFDTEIGDMLIGACNDLSIADIPPLVAYTERAVGVDRHAYINSGVLLMNLHALRVCNFEAHFLELLNTYHFDTVAPDQDYLNAICNGRIHYLDAAWDAMPNEAKPPLASPKLIHYNLFSKPWCYDGVQYGEFFWFYAYKTTFFEEICAYKTAYSAEKQTADSACLSRLIERGSEIANSELTFRCMREKGVKIRL